MYQQFFDFNTAPFSIAPDPDFIYMSQQHKEGLAHLLYGINQGGGFVALTGEVGTGKTTLCHCLLKKLPDDVDIALILNPKLDAIELLASVCDELHIVYDKNSHTLKSLIDGLNAYLLNAHANGKRTVLVIDEAQNLSLDVLENIRLLTNLETTKTKLLQIILIGQPELKKLLDKPELRQLNQRITARFHLSPLSLSETQKYINHRLVLCGGQTGTFSRSAIKKVYSLSKGVPRLINIICDRALLGAYVEDTSQVSTKIINRAEKEVFNRSSLFNADYKKLLLLLGGILTLSLLSVGYFYTTEKRKAPSSSNITSSIKKLVEGQILQQKTAQTTQKTLPNKVKLTTEFSEKTLEFNSYLSQSNMSLESGISELALLWGVNITLGDGCKEIEYSGLHCLYGKSNWKNLITLNRPAVLEFSLSETEKKYALLLQLKNGNPIFLFDTEETFPVDEILSLWKGYYVLLWQSPAKNFKTVFPGRSSSTVKWIKEKIYLNNSNPLASPDSDFFDDELKKEVIKFQAKHHLTPDGIVGTKTFIYLQNKNSADDSLQLRLVR